jgi:hypothetical protein
MNVVISFRLKSWHHLLHQSIWELLSGSGARLHLWQLEKHFRTYPGG